MDTHSIEFADPGKVKHKAWLSCVQQFFHMAKKRVTLARIQSLRQLSHDHFVPIMPKKIPVGKILPVVMMMRFGFLCWFPRLPGPRLRGCILFLIVPHGNTPLSNASGDTNCTTVPPTISCRNALSSCPRIGLGGLEFFWCYKPPGGLGCAGSITGMPLKPTSRGMISAATNWSCGMNALLRQ